MRLKTIMLLSLALAAASAVRAQGVHDICINEILVLNENNFEDDYGHRSGWIELHNTGYSNVNVAGCYLTVRRGDARATYRIPKNDPRTIIAPQGYLVFFAEGTSSKGTFHTNFTLGETGYLALLDQSGRGEAVDSIRYDLAAMKPDVSLGRYRTPANEEAFGELAATTPMSTNNVVEQEPRHEHFKRIDPYGIGMALIALTVVFVALIVLFMIFKRVGIVLQRVERRKGLSKSPAASVAAAPVAANSASGVISGETLAAIAMGLYKYSEDLHDIENTVLTINKVARAYSPWSSKIYGVNQNLNRK